MLRRPRARDQIPPRESRAPDALPSRLGAIRSGAIDAYVLRVSMVNAAAPQP